MKAHLCLVHYHLMSSQQQFCKWQCTINWHIYMDNATEILN
jgi:hypothetical protein